LAPYNIELPVDKNPNKIKVLLWVAVDLGAGHVPWGGVPVPYTSIPQFWVLGPVNNLRLCAVG